MPSLDATFSVEPRPATVIATVTSTTTQALTGFRPRRGRRHTPASPRPRGSQLRHRPSTAPVPLEPQRRGLPADAFVRIQPSRAARGVGGSAVFSGAGFGTSRPNTSGDADGRRLDGSRHHTWVSQEEAARPGTARTDGAHPTRGLMQRLERTASGGRQGETGSGEARPGHPPYVGVRYMVRLGGRNYPRVEWTPDV